jgi:gas vesicle protein
VKPNHDSDNSLDSGLLIAGFALGMLVGGIAALFKAPKSGEIRGQLAETGENLRNKIQSAVPADPIAESLAEGKAAARRRQAELGLHNS